MRAVLNAEFRRFDKYGVPYILLDYPARTINEPLMPVAKWCVYQATRCLKVTKFNLDKNFMCATPLLAARRKLSHCAPNELSWLSPKNKSSSNLDRVQTILSRIVAISAFESFENFRIE